MEKKYKEEIEIYYFLTFNEDYIKLQCAWRVPGEIVEKDHFFVWSNPSYEFDIEYMEEFNITERLTEVLEAYYPR